MEYFRNLFILEQNVISKKRTWNHIFCPIKELLTQTALKYLAAMTPTPVKSIQAIIIRQAVKYNTYPIHKSKYYKTNATFKGDSSPAHTCKIYFRFTMSIYLPFLDCIWVF